MESKGNSAEEIQAIYKAASAKLAKELFETIVSEIKQLASEGFCEYCYDKKIDSFGAELELYKMLKNEGYVVYWQDDNDKKMYAKDYFTYSTFPPEFDEDSLCMTISWEPKSELMDLN